MSRILSVDVLRGFALFGILFSHMVFWYTGGPLPDHFYRTNYGVQSTVAVGSYFILFMGKFLSSFSFLFGLSFYLQLNSLSKQGEHPVARFAWRLCLLGVIDVLHHTFWRGDVLSIYVPLGFLLIVFRSVSDRVLVIVGCLLVLSVPTLLMQGAGLWLNNSSDILSGDHKAEVALYYQAVSQDNLWQMCRDNLLGTYDKLVYQITRAACWLRSGSSCWVCGLAKGAGLTTLKQEPTSSGPFGASRGKLRWQYWA